MQVLLPPESTIASIAFAIVGAPCAQVLHELRGTLHDHLRAIVQRKWRVKRIKTNLETIHTNTTMSWSKI